MFTESDEFIVVVITRRKARFAPPPNNTNTTSTSTSTSTSTPTKKTTLGVRRQQHLGPLLIRARSVDTGAGVGLPPSQSSSTSADADVSSSSCGGGGGSVSLVKVSPLLAALYDLADGEWIHLRRITAEAACTLHSVILVPLTNNAPHQQQSPSELKQELLTSSHVIRQGGLVLTPSTPYFVLQTSPLQQGLLTPLPSTTITLLSSSTLDDLSNSKTDYDRIAQIWREHLLMREEPSPFPSPLLTSSIMRSPLRKTPLLMSSFMSASSSSALSFPLSPSPTATSIQPLRVRVMMSPLPLEALHPTPSPLTSRDSSLECLVSTQTLKQLRIFSGSTVRISQTQSPSQNYIARLYGVSSSPHTPVPEAGVILVSPLVAFHLNLDVTRTEQTVLVHPQQTAEQDLKIAREAYVARIKCPSSTGHANYRVALQAYFKHPKLMRAGSVFVVAVRKKRFLSLCGFDHADAATLDDEDDDDGDDDNNDDSDDSESDSQPHRTASEEAQEDELDDEHVTELVYFKLTRTVVQENDEDNNGGEFVWIDRSVTTLYQDGAVSSRIPTHSTQFYHRTASSQPTALWLTTTTGADPVQAAAPPGRSVQFATLAGLVRPVLHPLGPQLGLHFSLLLHGRAGSGKMTLIQHLASLFGLHLLDINCYSLLGTADTQTEAKLRANFKLAVDNVPCVLVLRHVDAFEHSASAQERAEPAIASALRELIQSTSEVNRLHREPLIVIGTTENVLKVSKTIRSCFRHEIALEMPDEKQRFDIISRICARDSLTLDRDVSLRDLALRTASFSPLDLSTMISHASTVALQRVVDLTLAALEFSRQTALLAAIEDDICACGISITSEDFEKAIHALHQTHSAALGTPKIPNINWEDVGGLMDAKREILDTIQLPLQHPELFGEGMRARSGILLFGPPGTGKTLLAKAVATECNLNFISVKGPELINMYVGESERNVRAVFQRARDARPCVIFFDELDSLAPNRGRNGDSGGVMDRIVSQLLAELSAMSAGSSDVFVIGATNRPDLIDPALLVPGRFDKLIYLGVNTDQKSRENIITAQTRKFKLGKSVDVAELARTCPGNLTGADLYALCSDALMVAIADSVAEMQKLDPTQIEELKKRDRPVDVLVEQRHFLEALKKLTPSVSFEELDRYEALAAKFTKKATAAAAAEKRKI